MTTTPPLSIMQYIEAINHSDFSFSSLKNICPIRNKEGRPVYVAGGQSIVFRVMLDGYEYALKCYTTRNKRYSEIYTTLSEIDSEIIPKMQFLKEEIAVLHSNGTKTREDILIYPWIDGNGMMEEITEAVNGHDTDRLLDLCHSFVNLARKLICLPICHGDLKPQNIIIDKDGYMKLIDLDMSLLSNSTHIMNEGGTIWYKHPYFDSQKALPSSIDDYAIAVIVVSLFALSDDPSLFHRFSNGENIIIDPRKICSRDRLSYELTEFFRDYPNYGELLDLLLSKKYIDRDIKLLLDNILTDTPLQKEIGTSIDTDGNLRRFLSTDGLYGYTDEHGCLIIGCCYGDATPFREGVSGVRINRNWFVIDDRGRKLSKTYYDSIGYAESGVMPVSKDRRWGYLSLSNMEIVTSFEYDYAYPFSDGAGLVCLRSRMFFIDAQGNRLFEGTSFDYARPFNNGCAIVGNGVEGKRMYYVINLNNRAVIRAIPQKILSYSDGYIRFREGEQIIEREVDLLKNK